MSSKHNFNISFSTFLSAAHHRDPLVSSMKVRYVAIHTSLVAAQRANMQCKSMWIKSTLITPACQLTKKSCLDFCCGKSKQGSVALLFFRNISTSRIFSIRHHHVQKIQYTKFFHLLAWCFIGAVEKLHLETSLSSNR